MEPGEFVRLWEKPSPNDSAASGEAALARLAARDERLSEASSEFLLRAGLPADAAPFLSFERLRQGLQSVSEVYGFPGCGTEWKQRLAPYLILGTDSEGSPICLDLAHGERIVLLDHEDGFRRFQFINGGVAPLAQFLLTYRDMIEVSEQVNGEDAYLDGDIPSAVLAKTVEEFRRIDPEAMAKGSFWPQDLKRLWA